MYNFPSLNDFKTGSQLPLVNERNEKSKAFADFDYKDDFEDDFEQDEEEEEEGDFDANELLNLTDYQNKRK